jgi:Zn-dependent protease with chaperone function
VTATRLGSALGDMPPSARDRSPGVSTRSVPHGVRTSIRPGIVSLIGVVPVLVGALAAIAPVGYAGHLLWPVRGAVVPFVVWCAFAPMVRRPTAQRWIARVAYGCREPDAAERDRLDLPWRHALRRAGIPDGRYVPVVMESAALNACAPTGPLLAVTSHAVRALAPDRLEAVLAHELGHRRGWHGLLTYVNAWLMLPIRALWWLPHVMWVPVAPMWRRAVAWHRPIGFLLTLLLAVAATAVSLVVALPAAIAYGGVAMARLLTRQAEYRADTAVVRLGLGAELLAALEHAIETGRDDRPDRPAAPPMPLVRRADRLRSHVTEVRIPAT